MLSHGIKSLSHKGWVDAMYSKPLMEKTITIFRLSGLFSSTFSNDKKFPTITKSPLKLFFVDLISCLVLFTVSTLILSMLTASNFKHN